MLRLPVSTVSGIRRNQYWNHIHHYEMTSGDDVALGDTPPCTGCEDEPQEGADEDDEKYDVDACCAYDEQ